ncbi:MAG: molybdopterin-binding protein, partial [Firmicutes bacterium]|nr:molybdopterin-binding protein [Bacillota bacterium]
MLKIPVEKALGRVLCHDITEIIPGKFKGRAFKKGHVITEQDIPRLLQIGKEHLYVWEKKEGFLH